MKALLAGSAQLKGGGGDSGRFQPPASDGDREDAAVIVDAMAS